ncbi:P22 phage major capsid protein family protein [Neobacillus sp. PS3-40]|uniref:P22 phage major capsid protein family protein n=1 Tax=Neobacillus sp. PS3-40 TaxID=3070679 RepID=UPI0027E129F6|nr:P22 phage major capsid protein family protein [Neobacillus sp. PS3-40]WML44083.1 P22 phage major capsid protein family protein [Neobacillus sp. PS3-40]
MSVQNFIPTVWSAKLNESLKKSLVFGNVVNSDYQGDVKFGNTVKINTIGAITIGDYDKSTGTGDPQELNSSQTTLLIDQQKFFNFKVEDIDKAQSNVGLLSGAMVEAGFGLADEADQYIANFYTEVVAGNTIGSDATPVVPTKDNAYDYLVDLGVKLSEANAPKSDRFVVVPEFYYGLLQKDARFTKDPAVLATGYIGNVNGMTVYTSNNVANTAGAKYKIMAGHKSAISFASQIDSVEAYRPEKSFSDAMKGLQVYGAKVIKPSALAVLTVNKA